MKEYIFITIWIGAIILFTIFYVKYRNKIKNFEHSLSKDVVKTRFNISSQALKTLRNLRDMRIVYTVMVSAHCSE